jgi:hypothetical protein
MTTDHRSGLEPCNNRDAKKSTFARCLTSFDFDFFNTIDPERTSARTARDVSTGAASSAHRNAMVVYRFISNVPLGTHRQGVKSSDEKPTQDKDAAKTKLSQSTEFQQIIEEYANDLREIIKKVLGLPN